MFIRLESTGIKVIRHVGRMGTDTPIHSPLALPLPPPPPAHPIAMDVHTLLFRGRDRKPGWVERSIHPLRYLVGGCLNCSSIPTSHGPNVLVGTPAGGVMSVWGHSFTLSLLVEADHRDSHRQWRP